MKQATITTKSKPVQNIVPPACIGIMGGGQLARMLAIAAKQMGYQIAILEPEANPPAKLFANYHIQTKYDDLSGLDRLAEISTVITTEFENVPAYSMEYLATKTLVYPSHDAISITQNRLKEKTFFNSIGVATTEFVAINTLSDISAINPHMFPAILKTNTMGYDGKGQVRVDDITGLENAFNHLGRIPAILEKMVKLAKEVSIMIAKNSLEVVCYPVVENIHVNGILDTTIAPARIDANLASQIEIAAKKTITKLDYIGILGIEFFITEDNQILANEMAPRPHNSGHYTLDASLTSQFEQQVRAICNLELGQSKSLCNAVMLNLLGDIWFDNTSPKWNNILGKYDNIKLHLYDKTEARIGRKMGHLNILGNDIEQLLKQAHEIRQILGF